VAPRNASITLVGPEPATLLPEVDPGTLRQGLSAYLEDLLRRPLDRSAEDLSATLLNIARCLYGIAWGRACVKTEAATWLELQVPEIRPGLRAALLLRNGEGTADAGSMRRAIVRLAEIQRTIERP
jgi:hypothetical protein